MESSHGEQLVGRDRDVMFSAFLVRGQADMATGLTGDVIAEPTEH